MSSETGRGLSRRTTAVMCVLGLLVTSLTGSPRRAEAAAPLILPAIEILLLTGAIGVFATAYACDPNFRRANDIAARWLVDQNEKLFHAGEEVISKIQMELRRELLKIQERLDRFPTACPTTHFPQIPGSEMPPELQEMMTSPLFQFWAQASMGLFVQHGILLPSEVRTMKDIELLQIQLAPLVSNQAFVRAFESLHSVFNEAAQTAIPMTWQHGFADAWERTSKCLREPEAWLHVLAGLGFWGYPVAVLAQLVVMMELERMGALSEQEISLNRIERGFDFYVWLPLVVVSDTFGLGPFHLGLQSFRRLSECLKSGDTTTLDAGEMSLTYVGIFLFFGPTILKSIATVKDGRRLRQD